MVRSQHGLRHHGGLGAAAPCDQQCRGVVAQLGAAAVQDGLAEQVGRLVELKEFLAAEIETFLDERERALARIRGIKNENMQDVLVYRYIVGLDWESVAKAMHYDKRHVYKIHGWALQAYEKVCEKDDNATK